MSAVLSAEQKALETRRNKLQIERKVLNVEITDLQKEASVKLVTIKKLQKQLDDLKEKAPKGIIVSEHAMLRYLQRVDGLDIEALQKRMLTENDREVIKKLGTCKIKTPDEVTLIVKDNVVVTVDEIRARPQPKKLKRYREEE